MRKLDYDNPGSPQDHKVFKINLESKSKAELLLIIGNVASACDMEGKGYVSEFEGIIRRAIGYTNGTGQEHAEECGCPRCEKEGINAYGRQRKTKKV